MTLAHKPLFLTGKLILAALTAALLCGLSACGGPRSASLLAAPDYGGLPAEAVPADHAVLHSPSGFTVRVADDPQLGAPDAQLQLTEEPTTAGVRLRVDATEASSLRGLYLEVSYDAARFSPVSAGAGGMLKEGVQLLELSDMSTPGTVWVGQVLANWDRRAGVDGTGTLASIEFANGAYQPPSMGKDSSTLNLALAPLRLTTGQSPSLFWYYTNPGDYDQNGEVSISDLTALGLNFGASGPFAFNTSIWMVDGDRNGEINIADITVIGNNFGNTVSGYGVYKSTDPAIDYPQSNSAADSIAPFFSRAFKDMYDFGGRLYTLIKLDEPVGPDDVYWVRLLSGDGTPGAPSNRSDQHNGEPEFTQPPLMFITADVVSGDAPLTVTLDASASYSPRGEAFGLEFYGDNEPDVYLYTDEVADGKCSFELLDPGSYQFYVRGLYQDYSPNSALLDISVADNGKAPPVAVFNLPNRFSVGNAPFTFTIDMSGSYDPDGEQLFYEFDLSSEEVAIPISRGSYEYFNGADPVREFTLEQPGSYLIDVKVSDSDGLTDVSYGNGFVVTDNGNQPPYLDFHLDPDAGTAPLSVDLLLDFAGDIDGEAVSFQIDPLGNGNWVGHDWFAGPFTFSFEQAGEFRPRARVTDNEGLTSYNTSDNSVVVDPKPGVPPEASLVPSRTEGFGNSTINFEARGSVDPYGRIVKYEFDFDKGAGWQDYGTLGWAEGFFVPGTFNVKVRVTDDEGLTDIAEVEILIHEI